MFISDLVKLAMDPFTSTNKKLYESKEILVPAIHLAKKLDKNLKNIVMG